MTYSPGKEFVFDESHKGHAYEIAEVIGLSKIL